MKPSNYIITLTLIFVASSCTDFLDVKPRKGLVVPASLQDFQALLEKEGESQQDPQWGEISSDDFYYEDAVFASRNEIIRNAYTWDRGDVFGNEQLFDWLYHYRFIYHANTVLEGLNDIERTAQNSWDWDKLKGEALFFRAKCHFNIANIWADAFDPTSATAKLGIPLRLHTDFNQGSVRSTLEETYRQIIEDLEAASKLLPELPVHVVRPSKCAAYALLARVNLFMRNYPETLRYADACLKLKSELMDYAELSLSASYPIEMYNKEVIYHSYMLVGLTNSVVSPDLMALYDEGDLRVPLFFRESGAGFKGSYYGRSTLFAGIAVDEVYLMRAEAYARTGELDLAVADLNYLLQNRYAPDAFEPIATTDSEYLLHCILEERRKELVFRGIRWPDVKRLNLEGAGIKMTRTINGIEHVLNPNDARFSLPIPQGVVNITGMEQNPR